MSSPTTSQSPTEEYERGVSIMRTSALEASVGYVTALCHASGWDIRTAIARPEYRAFSNAMRASYVAMIVGDNYDHMTDLRAALLRDYTRKELCLTILGHLPKVVE
jgi:hypothetical protein